MSTTGFDKIKNNNPKQALIFNDPICPNCSKNLIITRMPLKGDNVSIRYECKSCGFICPIGRDESNLEHTFPIYDNSINQFMEDFIELNNEEQERKSSCKIRKKKRKKNK